MQSFKKKIKTLIKDGTVPYEEGVANFNNTRSIIESLAKERSEVCKKCPKFVTEPIVFFRVNDKLIPELSNMMCDLCGCTLSYKTRQSIEICDKWQK